MKQSDAAKILNVQGEVTPEIIKSAFRKQAKKYHPDVNPAGESMMKLINSAFEVLKEFVGTVEQSENEEINLEDYPEVLNEALNAIFGLEGLEIEVCGAWVWVGGDTRSHKDVLKENSFKWANAKKKWYFRPSDWKSRSRGKLSMDEIRASYGSTSPKNSKKYLGAA